ncbi:hypothetical protein CLV72_1012 [Allonocardiopsis opalescens]|uniref:Uncharacterized protein n=1 Tax=Allonocardiopsis opalescens TaxID=1144618 RepID=A0A2T0QC21_9ACTN|nr:hypothetical protein CLV72_1012 [Allonocardiopsis opalescens]
MRLDYILSAKCPDCGVYVGEATTTPQHQAPGSRGMCPGAGKPTTN